MRQHLIWNLTVHFYPRAVEAGERPIATELFGCNRCSLAEGKVKPEAFYRPHTFAFDNPPSREQFLKIVEFLPWASNSWGNTLVPLLQGTKNEWPIITHGYKASSTDILDAQGRKVGHLEVCLERVWTNPAYYAAFVSVDAVNKATCHLRDRRQEANDYIDKHVNRVRERSIELGREKSDTPDRFVGQAIREVLVEGGFVQAKKKGKTNNGVVAGAVPV